MMMMIRKGAFVEGEANKVRNLRVCTVMSPVVPFLRFALFEYDAIPFLLLNTMSTEHRAGRGLRRNAKHDECKPHYDDDQEITRL